MPTCTFCKKSFKSPRGLTVFQFDGKSFHFCSSKCRKNMKLKRDPRKTNWVKKSGRLTSSVQEVAEQETPNANNSK
ncbi:MAG: hypothetical protein ACP5OG_05495 [Candidatus Nanoarchaeia archaeon]